LAALPIQIASPIAVATWESLLTLATRTQLTLYDAAYLQLAMQNGLQLATLDKELQQRPELWAFR
jgi:predicted nucleic acid-binding protein